MEHLEHSAFDMLEVVIAEQLESMGYQAVQSVNVNDSKCRFTCHALFPAGLVIQLAAVYFGTDRFRIFQQICGYELMEFRIYQDGRQTLSVEGTPVNRRYADSEQRRIVGELEIVLKSKARADFGYVRR